MRPKPYTEDLEQILDQEMAGGGGPGGLPSKSENEDASNVSNEKKGLMKRPVRTITKKKEKK